MEPCGVGGNLGLPSHEISSRIGGGSEGEGWRVAHETSGNVRASGDLGRGFCAPILSLSLHCSGRMGGEVSQLTKSGMTLLLDLTAINRNG